MPPWLYFSRPHNSAFHNLYETTTLMTGVRSLLGLGLNFCPLPKFTSSPTDVDLSRFRRDASIKFFFQGGPPLPPTKLFISSDWMPSEQQITRKFTAKIDDFSQHISKLYERRTCVTTLLSTQLTTLLYIQKRHDLIVWKTDKNLGPAIIERDEYKSRALTDHLLDSVTYRPLTQKQAHGHILIITKLIQQLVKKYVDPKDSNAIYLSRSLQVTDTYSYFYIMAKIHKSPWITRPIVSVSGSISHGLGRWVDIQLQTICNHLPYVIQNSTDLSSHLRSLLPQASTSCLFTMDATSMYTNIDTQHAFNVIEHFLQIQQPDICKQESISIDALIAGLQIIMTHNVFKFGDTFWVQLTGTAMGTPPAPMCATLYFAIHEINTVHLFPQLKYYGQYIDDVLAIWEPQQDTDNLQEQIHFHAAINSYGKFKWEASELSNTVNFLDLTILITPDHTLETKLFEKALNLYLYLPPHSAHPPGVLKGLIAVMIHHIY